MSDQAAAADFDFVLDHYGGSDTIEWLASCAHTYRNGDTLLEAFPRGGRWYDCADADRVLLAAERAGVLERGKVGFSHTTRAKGTAVYPYMHAWTLTELGRAWAAWRDAGQRPPAESPSGDYDLVGTGSRHGYDDAWDALDALVAELGPPGRVLAREQRGFDQSCREWALARGYELVPFDIDRKLPSPQRYHDGNQRMVHAARAGAVAAGFPDPGSTGTWDCLWRAARRGLVTYVADWTTRRLVLRDAQYIEGRYRAR